MELRDEYYGQDEPYLLSRQDGQPGAEYPFSRQLRYNSNRFQSEQEQSNFQALHNPYFSEEALVLENLNFTPLPFQGLALQPLGRSCPSGQSSSLQNRHFSFAPTQTSAPLPSSNSDREAQNLSQENPTPPTQTSAIFSTPQESSGGVGSELDLDSENSLDSDPRKVPDVKLDFDYLQQEDPVLTKTPPLSWSSGSL